ncbi:hypothetical protein Ait01nite_013520 [Actinoplanes italicus]|uniref:Peptidase inhibitor family I36 n=1 Tax=Actinoplanes italicus TaxID=113567 RepID=A0A2T0KH60_9ACTN|nr:hypothetical protein [Actinoplanes italicus]PRX22784.1 hypothetical protein CLV67_104312 [Actinoplanes italicus]GIE28307.1 hypothetical protein Ait01nite_013520 [Actinoplanes italicus]
MRIRSLLRPMAAVSLASVTMLALMPQPASADPATRQPGCRSTAKPIDRLDDNYHWPPNGTAVTTTSCADINIYAYVDLSVSTCFYPSSGGMQCNARRDIAAGTWGLAATDVRDYTRFHLSLGPGTARGLVAY